MQKTAQRKGIFNQLREVTDLYGISMEKLFSDELQKVMEDIREKDSKIRAIASGKEVDGADPGSDPISLKALLKSARTNFNRHEYMIVIDELGRFHNKLLTINDLSKKLNPPDQAQEDKRLHREFLTNNLDEERKSRLANLGERFSSMQEMEDQLFAEAGIGDFITDTIGEIGIKLPGSRGRALSSWEKRFPEHVKQLKSDTNALINASEKTLRVLLSSLNKMDGARAARNPNAYRKEAQKIAQDFGAYHTVFENFYKSHVKEIKDLFTKEAPAATQKAPGVTVDNAAMLANQNIPVGFKPAIMGVPQPGSPTGAETISAPDSTDRPTDPMSRPPPFEGSDYDKIMKRTLPGLAAPPTGLGPPTGGSIEGNAPAGGPLQPPRVTLPIASSHRKFYDELESLSNEHPLILATYIRKYAKSIQDSDPETCINLLKIVRSIKE